MVARRKNVDQTPQILPGLDVMGARRLGICPFALKPRENIAAFTAAHTMRVVSTEGQATQLIHIVHRQYGSACQDRRSFWRTDGLCDNQQALRMRPRTSLWFKTIAADLGGGEASAMAGVTQQHIWTRECQ